MATFSDLKKFGLALPEVEFFHLMRQPALRARRKTFAVWQETEKYAVMKLDRGHQMMLFEVRPKIFTPCRVGTGGMWSYVTIGKLGRDELKALVIEAWMEVVPKSVARAYSPLTVMASNSGPRR